MVCGPRRDPRGQAGRAHAQLDAWRNTDRAAAREPAASVAEGSTVAMAWTAPRTWVTGELVTASIMNSAVRDNLTELRAGGVAMASQAIGDLVYASSTTQFSRIA